MKRTVVIRNFTLREGARAEFQKLWDEAIGPLQVHFGVDLVYYGPSPHDDLSYCSIRAYDSLEHSQQSQEAFYSTAGWVNGPRAPALALIEYSSDMVLELDAEVVEGLRRSSVRVNLSN